MWARRRDLWVLLSLCLNKECTGGGAGTRWRGKSSRSPGWTHLVPIVSFSAASRWTKRRGPLREAPRMYLNLVAARKMPHADSRDTCSQLPATEHAHHLPYLSFPIQRLSSIHRQQTAFASKHLFYTRRPYLMNHLLAANIHLLSYAWRAALFHLPRISPAAIQWRHPRRLLQHHINNPRRLLSLPSPRRRHLPTGQGATPPRWTAGLRARRWRTISGPYPSTALQTNQELELELGAGAGHCRANRLTPRTHHLQKKLTPTERTLTLS